MLSPGPHVVAKILHKESKYGGSIYTITFISNHAEITHTYVDPDNRNAKVWADIIDLYDRGYGIVLGDLRYKLKDNKLTYKNNTNEPLINADSKVRILYATPNRQEVMDQLYEVLK